MDNATAQIIQWLLTVLVLPLAGWFWQQYQKQIQKFDDAQEASKANELALRVHYEALLSEQKREHREALEALLTRYEQRDDASRELFYELVGSMKEVIQLINLDQRLERLGEKQA